MTSYLKYFKVVCIGFVKVFQLVLSLGHPTSTAHCWHVRMRLQLKGSEGSAQGPTWSKRWAWGPDSGLLSPEWLVPSMLLWLFKWKGELKTKLPQQFLIRFLCCRWGRGGRVPGPRRILSYVANRRHWNTVKCAGVWVKTGREGVRGRQCTSWRARTSDHGVQRDDCVTDTWSVWHQ